MDAVGAYFIVIVAIGFIWFLYKYPEAVTENSAEGPIYRVNLSGHEADIDKVLQNEMYYYQTLSPEKKKEFVTRVIRFNSSTSFYPQRGLKMEPRHVILISATFVEITFGLPSSLMEYLNNIRLFPSHYRDPRTNRQYKGEVDLNGMISLSWEDFEIGLRDAKDGRNVGLHELAHAFAIEIIEKDAHYHDLLMKLRPVFMQAKFEINNPYYRHNLLREYGYTNLHEYFAVATEVYFENPGYLANSGSPLYNELSVVFNQDPYKQYSEYEASKQ